MKRLLILAAIVIAIPTFVCAAPLATPGAQLISQLTQGQLTATKQFSAPMGLEGYVAKAPNGEQTILFTDKLGHYLVAGNIVAKTGQNLTQHYTAKYINADMAKSAYKDLSKTHWITDGKDSAAHKLYVFWDPDCSICHMLFQDLRPFIKAGKVQVRWIPIAIRPHSKSKTPRVMLGKTNAERLALMTKDEKGFVLNPQKGIEEGGLRGITTAASKTKAGKRAEHQTQVNTNVFIKNHFMGTPVILYKNAKTGQEAMEPGYAPSMLKSLLKKISSKW